VDWDGHRIAGWTWTALLMSAGVLVDQADQLSKVGLVL
jgi:hypothetical protein